MFSYLHFHWIGAIYYSLVTSPIDIQMYEWVFSLRKEFISEENDLLIPSLQRPAWGSGHSLALPGQASIKICNRHGCVLPKSWHFTAFMCILFHKLFLPPLPQCSMNLTGNSFNAFLVGVGEAEHSLVTY